MTDPPSVLRSAPAFQLHAEFGEECDGGRRGRRRRCRRCPSAESSPAQVGGPAGRRLPWATDYHSAMDDTTRGVRIRRGGPADAPAVLAMLDSAVVWMNDRGNTEQWGTTPFSEKPERVEQVDRYLTENLPFIAEVDGTPAAALVLDSGPDPRAPIAPAEEPERYVRLLVSDRRFAGRNSGRPCWHTPSRKPGGPACGCYGSTAGRAAVASWWRSTSATGSLPPKPSWPGPGRGRCWPSGSTEPHFFTGTWATGLRPVPQNGDGPGAEGVLRTGPVSVGWGQLAAQVAVEPGPVPLPWKPKLVDCRAPTCPL